MSPSTPPPCPFLHLRYCANSIIILIHLVLISIQISSCNSTAVPPATSASTTECSALRRLLIHANGSQLSDACNCTQENYTNGTVLPLLTWSNNYDKKCISCSAPRYIRVRCMGNLVTELSLINVGVPKDSLSVIATAFKHLKHLDLSSNNITGSIPPSLWALKKLSYLNLSSNKLINFSLPPNNDSLIPTSPALSVLDLANNHFRVPFPLDLCSRFPNLTTLIVSSNNFRGSAPNLSLCHQLEHFDVSFNKLSGKFGSLNSYMLPLNLSKLNVSHNNLVVGFSSHVILKFGLSSFWPNKACTECFRATHASAMTSSSPSPSPSPSPFHSPPIGINHGHASALTGINHGHASIMKEKETEVVGSVVGGTILMLFISITLCVVVVINRRHKKELWPPCKTPVPPFKHTSAEIGPFSFESQSGTWVADVKDPSNVPVVIFHKPLLNLTFGNLISATGSFNRDSEVGDGTGLVYTCVLPGALDGEEAKVAIKVVEDGHRLSMKDAENAFKAMGEMVNHVNMVPLLGYCIVGEEKLLIYKHMEGGTLEDFLHAVPEGASASPLPHAVEDWSNIETWPDHELDHPPQSAASCTKKDMVDWEVRLKIGLGVARALAYLHYGCRRPIIHGAVSSSCILLDGGHVAKLANYSGGWGLSRRMTTGFVAPECTLQSSTGSKAMVITAKCDVYSMGVVLLELATGRRAVAGDSYRGFATLVAWVRALTREKKAERAIDPQLPAAAHPHVVEVIKMGYLCTADCPSKRPSIQQVVGLLKDLVSP